MVIVPFLFLMPHLITVDAAKCEGTVIFYWRETGEARQEEERNWGRLEKELEGNQGRLVKFFDTKSAYATTVTGDCCWEVYAENFFKGKSAKLKTAFSGIPGYPQFNANSLKKVDC